LAAKRLRCLLAFHCLFMTLGCQNVTLNRVTLDLPGPHIKNEEQSERYNFNEIGFETIALEA